MAPRSRDFDPATFDPNADLLPLVTDLTLLALVGHRRPAAAGGRTAIAEAHAAGIQVRMITGDHAVTAEAIAGDLGIRGEAITGAEWGDFSDDEATATHRRHRRHRPRHARSTRSASSTSSSARATSSP